VMLSFVRSRKRRPREGLAILVVAVSMAAPTGALFAEAADLTDVLMKSDQNGDGVLQRSEAPVGALARFRQADRDGNGVVDAVEAVEFDAGIQADSTSRAEVVQPASEPAKAIREATTVVELLEAADRNGDGRLAWGECPEAMRANFMPMDANRDGFIDLGEARELDAHRAGASAVSAGPGPGPFVRLVGRMDTDGDGQLQKREAPLRLQKVFEQFDSNADGAIDASEAHRADQAAAARRESE
jgi:Ca2+-binding EF-hand superfamily protein